MKRTSMLLIGALAVGCEPAAPPAKVATVMDSLQGTWRVARFPTFPGSDTITFHFGVAPVGYLVYDATGHVFWQVMNRTVMDSFALARQRQLPDTVLYRLSKGFVAQFGTYTVNATERTVLHQYEGETELWGRGRFEVATPFELRADSLFIGTDTLKRWRFVRVR